MKKVVILLIAIIALSTVYATTVKFTTDNLDILEEIEDNPHLFYFELAKQYFESGEIDKSIEFFKQSILLDNSFAPSFHNLGVAYYEKNNIKEAEKYLVKAVNLNPKYSKAHYSLGLLYFETSHYDAAITHFEQSLKFDKNNPNKNFDLAQAYVAKYRQNEKIGDYKDLKQAINYLKKTIKLNPDFPNAKNNLEIVKSILEERFEDKQVIA